MRPYFKNSLQSLEIILHISMYLCMLCINKQKLNSMHIVSDNALIAKLMIPIDIAGQRFLYISSKGVSLFELYNLCLS